MRGPELFGFSCILLLLPRGELIQCCTQNFPCAEGELIKCNTKTVHFILCELRREPKERLKYFVVKSKPLAQSRIHNSN